MKVLFLSTVCLCLLGVSLSQKTAEEWKTRIVYHILTDRFSNPDDNVPECTDLQSWCGGNFQGIMNKLDYIKDLGANAIWISPIVLNTNGGYHGYWAKNIYEVEPHWGTKEELKELVQKCHDEDIWVMVDVVPNHMGYPHDCDGWPNLPSCTLEKLVNFTGFTPFDQAEHYHQYCNTDDWNNQTQVELCRLANLPDLNQTVPEVKQLLMDWIRDLTAEYGFDGYRVDTVKHIEKSFWTEYQEAAGAFCMGEVWNEKPEYTGDYQNYMDSLFNFPNQDAMRKVFHNNESMTHITNSLEGEREHFKDVTVLGLFVDNHDQARFLHGQQDKSLFKNALLYSVLGEGIPFIYYGSEQGFNGGNDPDCRESLWPHHDTESDLFKFIKTAADLRHKHIEDFNNNRQIEVMVDDQFMAFTRAGLDVMVFQTNIGTGQSLERTITGLLSIDGTLYVNIYDQTDTITVSNGELNIQLNNGLPKVYVKSELNSGVQLHCGVVSIFMVAIFSMVLKAV